MVKYTLIVFILSCGLFEVCLNQPETTNKEAGLKKLGNFHSKLKSRWTSEDELVRIADELMRLDECEEAIPFWTKAIPKQPNNRGYYRNRANCYSKIGKWSEAYSDFKKDWMLYKGSGDEANVEASALRWLCAELVERKKHNEAVLCFTDAIKKDPSNYLYNLWRGDCYKTLKDYDSAKLDYREALAKNPKDIETRISLIRVLFLAEKTDEAVAEMRFLSDVELGKLGDDFRDRENKFTEGILCYTEASKQSHLDPEYNLKRGSCYEKMNKLDEAINDYRDALQKKPNDEFTSEKLILAQFKAKRIDEASNVIRSLSGDQLKYLEERFLSSYAYECAIPIITEAIERNSDDASKYNSRGRCYLALGNLDSALSDFEGAIKLAPSDKAYLFNQMKVLFKIGRSTEAIEKLVGLEEAQLQSMGDVLIEDGKFVEALQCFTEAIRRNPDNSYSHEKAGECYWLNGDFEMSKLETEKAISLLPIMNKHRTDLEIMWCEKMVTAGKFPEARLALKNLEAKYEGYGYEYVPNIVSNKAAALREEMIKIEQRMRVSPSFA